MSWVKGVAKSMVLRTLPAAAVTTTAARITAAQITENLGANAGIILQADPGNSGVVYVGDSTVTTTTGVALTAGSSITLLVFDPYSIYAVASTGTQSLRINYV